MYLVVGYESHVSHELKFLKRNNTSCIEIDTFLDILFVSQIAGFATSASTSVLWTSSLLRLRQSSLFASQNHPGQQFLLGS